MAISKTLILVPALNFTGGVANYYNTLGLDSNEDFFYFIINKGKPQSYVGTACRLLWKYINFLFIMIKGNYHTVIINPSITSRSFYRDSVFIILARLLRKKTVIFFRGWVESFEDQIKASRFNLLLFRISYARADKYMVLGNIFKKKLIAMGVPREAKFFIETTVADSSYLEQLDLTHKYQTFQKEVKILFLARIIKEKGIYIAIDAFREYLIRLPQKRSCLIIAGEGPELAPVKSYVQTERIPNIIFMGNVSGGQKMKLLLESHIMIFPSFDEGLPNSILEGMLYGMPIISRAIGGIPEVIDNYENGFLTESYDPLVFADLLFRIVSSPSLYKLMSENNHQIALQKYTCEKVKDRFLNIFQG